jgi:hypothetical protein
MPCSFPRVRWLFSCGKSPAENNAAIVIMLRSLGGEFLFPRPDFSKEYIIIQFCKFRGKIPQAISAGCLFLHILQIPPYSFQDKSYCASSVFVYTKTKFARWGSAPIPLNISCGDGCAFLRNTIKSGVLTHTRGSENAASAVHIVFALPSEWQGHFTF